MTPAPFPDVIDATRAARWRRALAWRDVRALEGTRPATSPAERHGIVLLDMEWTRPARDLAAGTQRPLAVVRALSEVTRVVRRDQLESVLVACPPWLLDWSAMDMLERQLDVPWGLLTAADQAGLDFLVAKMTRDRLPAPARSWGIVDGDDGSLHGPGEVTAREADGRLADLLGQWDFDCLVVFAHGEGGHLNLHDAVLCGLLDEVERDTRGAVLDGCRVAQGIRECKRAPQRSRPVISPAELRARSLALLSCTSASVSGSPYESRNSGVLAALDGFTSSVLAVRDATVLDREEGELALGLLSHGSSWGRVRDVLNDVQRRRHGASPYVLFGDPAQASPGAAPEAAERGRPVLAVRELVSLGTTAVLGSAPPHRGTGVGSPVLCRGQAFVGMSGYADAVEVVDVVDLSQETREARRRLINWSVLLPGAARFERAVMRRYAAAIEADAAFYRLCDGVFGLRVALEQRIQAGLEVLTDVARTGVHSPSLDFWVSTAGDSVAAWDEAVAGLFARWLLAGDPFDALADALSAGAPTRAGSCEVCGSPLVESALIDPLSEQVVRYVVRCPLCGDRENWPRGGARIHLDQPPASQPGQREALTFRVTGADGDSGRSAAGHLLVQAFDKANRRVFFDVRTLEQAGRPREIIVDVPPDVAGDLHYLWFVWVSRLQVSVLRRRWLCVRPTLLPGVGAAP